jgi:hypothetical protein
VNSSNITNSIVSQNAVRIVVGIFCWAHFQQNVGIITPMKVYEEWVEMKLAEALILRSDGQRKIEQLKHRLEQVVKVQEDDTPSEDPHELFQELARTVDEVYVLIRKINKTNAQTWFDEQRTLADVLTERDRILTKRRVLSETLQHATTK